MSNSHKTTTRKRVEFTPFTPANPSFVAQALRVDDPINRWFAEIKKKPITRLGDLEPHEQLLVWAAYIEHEVQFNELREANREPITWA